MIQDFITYLEVEKRYSAHTIKAYQADLDAFFTFHQIKNVKQIHRSHIRAWVINLSESGIENRSINRKLSSLKSFFRFKQLKEGLKTNPTQGVVTPKQSKKLPEFVPEKDLDKIEEDLEDLKLDPRSKAIVELFYQTGVRLSELINLKKSDVSSSEIKVLGKRNKERIIPISQDLYQLIKDWEFSAQENISYQNQSLLFITDKGQPLYPNFVYRLVNKVLSSISTLSKKSPHVLRHSFATHMLNNGAEIESVKELLGHSSLAATQVYTHNSISKLKNVYDRAHPRGK